MLVGWGGPRGRLESAALAINKSRADSDSHQTTSLPSPWMVLPGFSFEGDTPLAMFHVRIDVEGYSPCL